MKTPREQPKQINFTMSEKQTRPSNETRPIEAVKAKVIDKLSEVIKIKNKEEGQMWLKDKQLQESERVKNENEEQKHKRLDDKQH